MRKKTGRVLSLVLSLALVGTIFMAQPISVSASDSQSFDTFKKTQLSKVYPDIKVIAKGYVQKNGKISTYWAKDTQMYSNVKAYALPSGMTSIQGVEIDSKYKLDKNAQKWQDYLQSKGFYRLNSDFYKDCAYYATVTDPLKIVAYDKNYVYYWSEGFLDTSAGFILQCTTGNFNTVHVPGFYKLERKNVWIDAGKNYVTGSEPASIGTGTISYSAGILPEPGDSATGAVWALGVNKKIDVISAEKVAANNTSGNTYYKVKFRNTSNGTAGYCGRVGTYYVNSRYLNLRLNGETTPEILGTATVKPSPYVGINAREEKDLNSKSIGLLGNGAKIDIISRDSDWAKVYFSGQVGYMQSKYLKNFAYTPYTASVTKLSVGSVDNSNPVVTWEGNSSDCSYKLILGKFSNAASNAALRKKMATIDKYEGTSFTVADKYFTSTSAGKMTYLYVYPQKKMADGAVVTGTKATKIAVFKPVERKLTANSLHKMGNKLYYTIGKSTGGRPTLYSEVKCSTKKNMKSAKVVSRISKGTVIISGLKKNKTYYFQRRYYYKYEAGDQTFTQYGAWSNILKKKIK